MSKKVLITGAAGFIGFALAKRLFHETDYELLLVDNFDRAPKSNDFVELISAERVRFFDRDLRAETSLDDIPEVEFILHCAAVVGVENVEKRAIHVLEVNILSSFWIARFANRCQTLERLVFASTSEVYAGTLNYFGMTVPTPEETPITLSNLKEPRSTYSLSKIVGESIFSMGAAIQSMPCIAVRYHNIYGPRMGYQHVIPQLFCKLHQLDEVVVSSPTHSRAFCFISDAIDMTLSLMAQGKNGEVYNVGNPTEEIAIFELAKLMRSIVNPQAYLAIGQDNPGSPTRRCPNIGKSEQLIGRPKFVSLAAGLAKTWDWYRLREDLPKFH